MQLFKVILFCRAEGRRVGTFEAGPGEMIDQRLLGKRLVIEGLSLKELGDYVAGCANGRQLLCPRCGNNLEYLLDGQEPAVQPYRPQLGRFALQQEAAENA